MRIISSIAVAAFTVGAPALAQNGEVLVGPVPGWVQPSEPLPAPENASGLFFVRAQDTLVHLAEDGQSTYTSQRIKILHPQALNMGNVALVWNPASGAPTVHSLRIHRDGAAIDVLKTAEFEILRREDQLETAMLDGLLTAVLRVPDLRVADELEFAFTVPSHDPTMGSASFGLLSLANEPMPGRFRLGISWEDGQKPDTRLTPDLAASVEVGHDALEVRVDNPQALTPPRDAPLRYAWQRMIEFSDFGTWSDVSRRFSGIFEAAAQIGDSSPLAQEAERIAASHGGELARAQAALELVQRQVRYVYVGLNGGNLTPAGADETWQRRYGDCKGKTVLLLALLDQLGIEAEAVLANNSGLDDGFDQRLPSPGLFDHVLVRAKIGGKTYWMDGTLPDVAAVSIRPVIPYRWVLPLAASGHTLEAIPFEPFALPREMGVYEIDARAGFDEPGKIKQTTVKRGIEGLAEYAQFSALTREQLEGSFRSALVGSPQWNSIDAVEYRYDRDHRASILTIAGTGPVDWEAEGGGEYHLMLPGGGFSAPNRRQRGPDQDPDAPFYTAPTYTCHVTTVRLPEGTDLEHWGFNTVYDKTIYGRLYYRMMELRDDRTIRMVRGTRVEQPEISRTEARRDNTQLANFDNSKAYIMYDPEQVMEPWGTLSSVPATYEIDWTGPDAPCLPGYLMEDIAAAREN